MTNKFRVVWDKWEDPLAPSDEAGEARTVDYDKDESEIASFLTRNQVMPVNRNSIPSRVYNLWLGHTSFNFTEQMFQAVMQVPGVETLDVATRYRFRVGIGRAFSEAVVKQRIESVLKPLAFPADFQVHDRLRDTIVWLCSRYIFWECGEMEDGTINYATGVSREEVVEKSEPWRDRAVLVRNSWGAYS